MTINQNMKDWLHRVHRVPKTWTDDSMYIDKLAELIGENKLTAEMIDQIAETGDCEMSAETKAADPDKLMAGSKSHVRLQRPSERYDDTKQVGKHARLGIEIINGETGRPAMLPSERERAKIGSLLKHLAQRAGLPARLSEHERELLEEACHEDEWVGVLDGQDVKMAGGPQIKALLDDSTSGGIEVAPIFFDSQIIEFPLLTGEIVPYCDVQQVPRGRRIESASLGNPTVTWGTSDATEVALFTTDGLINELNSTIFDVGVAIELGRNWLSDSSVDIGTRLTGAIGRRMAEELDRVVMTGNGSDRPSGLTGTAGISTITTDNSTTGPPTLADYTSLLFALGKEYRTGAFRPRFISNDTTFARSREIHVDPSVPTTDQRPIVSDVNSFNTYQTLGFPHQVQNDVANEVAFFGNLSRYRLYRRQGLSIAFEMGGSYLQRRNLSLLIARGRFGGRVMDTSAFVKWTDGQS